MYDTAIVGSGPAAVSAALNLKLHNKDFIWFGSPDLSQKVEKSHRIANYPGVPMAAGPDLNRAFAVQVQEMGLEITPCMVTNITKNRRGFMILGGNDIYDARSVLLCIGAAAAKGFPGEEEFLGRGVSYCATCDGFLYKGKTIAVYCGDPRFEHEVTYLAELAEKVYLFTSYRDCGITAENVDRMNPSAEKAETEAASPGEGSFAGKPRRNLREIRGTNKADTIVLTDGSEAAVDGIFILRNAVAPAALFRGLEMDGPHIRVDRAMRTNIAGCYAAGDCTGRPYQIAKAVGEGNTAAHSILEYLALL